MVPRQGERLHRSQSKIIERMEARKQKDSSGERTKGGRMRGRGDKI